MDEQFLSVAQAASRMGMSEATLRTKMSREPWSVPAHYRSTAAGGGRVLFRPADVDDHMAKRRVEPPPAPIATHAAGEWAKWRSLSTDREQAPAQRTHGRRQAAQTQQLAEFTKKRDPTADGDRS